MVHKLAGAAAGALLALVLVVSPAGAQYGPDVDTTLATVRPGQPITVTGSGYPPGVTITLTLLPTSAVPAAFSGAADGVRFARPAAPSPVVQAVPAGGYDLGTTTANDDGTFSAQVVVPADAPEGDYVIRAAGGGVVADTPITISETGAAPGDPGGTADPGAGAPGSLPRTGSDARTFVVVGVALVVVGGLALLALRSRRADHAGPTT